MRTRDIISAIKNVKKAKIKIERMNKIYPKRYAEELYLIGDNVITQWYSSYNPIFYNREGRLYKAFKVRLHGTEYSVDFDSSFIGNNIIFENSFMQGYHGGAYKGTIKIKDEFGKIIKTIPHPHPGIPYWLTPFPQFTEWGRPAKRSFSPYTRMVSEMNKKIKEIDDEKQAEFDTIMLKVEKAINRLY